MLLEVNDLTALIVAGAPPPALSDIPIWRKIAGHYRCLIYVRDTESFNGWLDTIGDDVTILFWDTNAANEVADNLRFGMEILESEPYQTAYIAFDATDLVEAVAARIGTIQVGGNWHSVLPDVYLNDIAELATMLANRKRGHDRGYIGEIFSTMMGKVKRWPGTGVLMWDERLLAGLSDLDPQVTSRLRVAILGRYFPPSDLRHAKHQFSRRILYAKNKDSRARPLIEPLRFALHHLVNATGFDIVTRIPPKPSSRYDHVAWLVNEASRGAEAGLIERLAFNALSSVRDYSPQKYAGSYAKRATNVAGVFKADTLVRGRRVLIVDDVLTSGSTVTSAASELLATGAASVGVLAIGLNQNYIHRGYGDPSISCVNGCGGQMMLQFSTQSNAAFWGCSNWRSGCKAMQYFRLGLQASNAKNRRHLIEVTPDIGF